MAGRIRTDEPSIAPADEAAAASYDRDFYSWTQEQARLVRAGQWARVDRENVAEEIESLGRTEFNKLESALRIILLHMLKWDHQPARRSRSWALSISQQRLELDDVLADNPGLRPRIDDAIARAFRKARLQAVQQTNLNETQFPVACPYSWDDLVSREFSR